MEYYKKLFSKNIIWSIIIVLYYFLYAVERVIDIDLMKFRWLAGMSGYLFLWTYNSKNCLNKIENLCVKINTKNVKRIKYYIVLLVFSFISIYINKNISINGFLYSLHFYGVALILLNVKLNHKIIKISYASHVIFYVYHILIGTDPNFLFNVSRNYVSIILLVQISLLYITEHLEKKTISVLPAYINLFLSIWAVGRAGIIVSFLMIIGVYTAKIKNQSLVINFRYLYKVLGVILVLLIIMFIIMDPRLLYERLEYYLSRGLQSSGRSMIINEYVLNMASEIKMFFWGVPIYGNEIFMKWDGNLHNSYLRAHYTYGLFGVIILIAGILNSLYRYLKSGKVILLFLLLSICVRLFTDTAAFYGIFDPLVFYFIYNGFETEIQERV